MNKKEFEDINTDDTNEFKGLDDDFEKMREEKKQKKIIDKSFNKRHNMEEDEDNGS